MARSDDWSSKALEAPLDIAVGWPVNLVQSLELLCAQTIKGLAVFTVKGLDVNVLPSQCHKRQEEDLPIDTPLAFDLWVPLDLSEEQIDGAVYIVRLDAADDAVEEGPCLLMVRGGQGGLLLQQGPPALVEGIARLLVQVDVVPQQLHIHLFTVLGQGGLGELYSIVAVF